MTITTCPQCGSECNETFFEPKDPSDYDTIEIKDNRRIGYKHIGNTIEINPYVDGGTFLMCKNCCLYTFYPRSIPS